MDCNINPVPTSKPSKLKRMTGPTLTMGLFVAIGLVARFCDDRSTEGINIPPCQESDRADAKVVDMPPDVSNTNIGDEVCFVRVATEDGRDRIELRMR